MGLIVSTIIYALLGGLVGVIINHAANVLPTRTTLRQVPSCPTCRAIRPKRQWSGLVSLAINRHYCPQCGQIYPTYKRAVAVEGSMLVLFGFLMWRYGLSRELLIVSFHTTVLMLVTITDLEHRLIFNLVILPSILIAVILVFFTPDLSWFSAIMGGIGAFILMYLAALASRGGLGEGDVTLSAYLGFILGFPKILLGLTFGVFLGGFTALFLLATGQVGLKSYIPYGPFLTVSGWIMLIWGDEIWDYFFF
jgi:prepilin signal peptidase PulO-like enzyme (type II secretory pathway)